LVRHRTLLLPPPPFFFFREQCCSPKSLGHLAPCVYYSQDGIYCSSTPLRSWLLCFTTMCIGAPWLARWGFLVWKPTLRSKSGTVLWVGLRGGSGGLHQAATGPEALLNGSEHRGGLAKWHQAS
jgi:hypothetical protein